MELFGFEIKKKSADERLDKLDMVVVPDYEDGANDLISVGPTGGRFVDVYDHGAVPEDEVELITTYRSLSNTTEVDKAVSEIVNDAVTYNDNEVFPVSLNLDEIDISDKIKTKIEEEFVNILYLLDFHKNGYDIFRKWYVDGRLYANLGIDSSKPKEGIKKITIIDSIFIKKVREIEKDVDGKIKGIEEYFIYTPEDLFTSVSGYGANPKNAVRLTSESVTYSTSGIYAKESKRVLSYLHKAIKPANQLSSIEDSIVIYRVTRAPERRVFYIDVGNLPKTKAEEYLNAIMNKYRNKVVYNSTTGKIDESKKQMTMLEDYWLPRREGGRGTEIDTIQGGENLGQMDDVQYFRKKLYESLNVPTGRIDSEGMFSLGKSAEISREEVKFSKFIDRLRKRFSYTIFNDILYKQLVLKGIITKIDWEKISRFMRYTWQEDSHFAEMKELQVMSERIEMLERIDAFRGTYFSLTHIRTNVLHQDEEEQKQLKKEREDDKKEGEDMTDGEGEDREETVSQKPAPKQADDNKDTGEEDDGKE